ncbi:MAG: hypothetical protein OXR62_11875 [Ahrensia sp.]|nr:hypothetical protein [Ahrensia sp.]
MKITSIRAATLALPIPKPVILGRTKITTRDVVVLRLTTEDGAVGEAIGYTRATPLLAGLKMIAHSVLGADSCAPRRLSQQLANSNSPGRAQMSRAYSLVDIALWGVVAHRSRMPLFQLLGGAAQTIKATAVAGYYLRSRTADDVINENKRRFDEGYARVKTMIDGANQPFDLDLCEKLAALPASTALDAHWSWTQLEPARRFCQSLDGMGFDFVEDPFPAGFEYLTASLQHSITTPLAAGEDAQGLPSLARIARDIGVLRVDATTCGGLSTATDAIACAKAAGRIVSPHVFAPLHMHLACAFETIDHIEIIPEDVGSDPLPLVLKHWPDPKDGQFCIDDRPGNGIIVDWEKAESFCVDEVLQLDSSNSKARLL